MLHPSVAALYGQIFCAQLILFQELLSTRDCRPTLAGFSRRTPAFVRSRGVERAGSQTGARSLSLSASRTRYMSKPPTFRLRQPPRREHACSIGSTLSTECDSCSTTKLVQDDGASRRQARPNSRR